MSVSTLTSCIAQKKQRLREMLSDCHAFQTWQGNTWTPAQALARIYLDVLDPPGSDASQYTAAELTSLRPFAVISAAGIQFDREAETTFSIQMQLTVTFEEAIEDTTDPELSMHEFADTVGRILVTNNPAQPGLIDLQTNLADDHLMLLAAQDDPTGPHRGHEEDVHLFGDYHYHFIQVSTGWDA